MVVRDQVVEARTGGTRPAGQSVAINIIYNQVLCFGRHHDVGGPAQSRRMDARDDRWFACDLTCQKAAESHFMSQ
jgi:hypothetical protein